HHLAEGVVQYLRQVEGLVRHAGDGVERVQFAVAPPYRLLGALLLRDVEQEALITLDASLGIVQREARFADLDDGAVFAAQVEFEVAQRAMLGNRFAETPAVI